MHYSINCLVAVAFSAALRINRASVDETAFTLYKKWHPYKVAVPGNWTGKFSRARLAAPMLEGPGYKKPVLPQLIDMGWAIGFYENGGIMKNICGLCGNTGWITKEIARLQSCDGGRIYAGSLCFGLPKLRPELRCNCQRSIRKP